MSTATRSREKRAPSRGEDAVTGLLMVGGALTVVGTAIGLVQQLNSFIDGSAPVAFPVQTADAQVDPATTARFTELTLSSAHLSFWPTFWLAVSACLWAVVTIVLAVLLVRFALSMARNEPFAAGMPTALFISAVAVGVGGSAALVAKSWGTSTARSELLSEGGPLADALSGSTNAADLAQPLVAGGVLLLLGLAFRSGMRMRRDTEGLV